MTCSEFLEGFSEYRDGTGSEAFLLAARAHRASCDACTRYEEVYERGLELLHSFPAVEVSDDFQPRLQHRLYHVADEAALTGGAAGSGASGAAAFAIAVVLAVAAWSPVLRRLPEVELSPIVVSEPVEEPLWPVEIERQPSLFSYAPVASHVSLPPSPSVVPENLWAHSHSLLYEYSPLSRGYVSGSPLVRTRFE